MSSLPARFSEKYFRKYEPYIALVTTTWPKPVDFAINGSVTTFACRLRDAMRSYHEHKWPSDSINVSVFDQIYRSPTSKDFVVQEQPDGIVRVCSCNLLLSRDSVKASVNNNNGNESLSVSQPPVELLNLTPDDIDLACRFAHSRLLQYPLILNMSPDTATAMMNKYDIFLDPQNDGNYLLT